MGQRRCCAGLSRDFQEDPAPNSLLRISWHRISREGYACPGSSEVLIDLRGCGWGVAALGV